MESPRTFVIVGAGPAGAKTAEALRKQGYNGRIVLVGAEAHRPYERPVTELGMTTSCSAATSPSASSSRSGCAIGASRPR